jgi:hypothetical protein
VDSVAINVPLALHLQQTAKLVQEQVALPHQTVYVVQATLIKV